MAYKTQQYDKPSATWIDVASLTQEIIVGPTSGIIDVAVAFTLVGGPTLSFGFVIEPQDTIVSFVSKL